MPTYHTLEAYLDSHIEAAGICGDGKSPLFRSAAGRTGDTVTLDEVERISIQKYVRPGNASDWRATCIWKAILSPSGGP